MLHDGPVIELVDQLIQRAIQQTASDIHIEPYAEFCRIRYRRDGILYEVIRVPNELAARLVARLKLMAKLDTTERRTPQDGHFYLFTMDLRINTCPTVFGEKIVLRLLDAKQATLAIDSLGLNLAQVKLFLEKISRPQGMVLVTGPTGSGKTVTLYSALAYLNSVEKNISTVEDPVEIQLAGINQVNICMKTDLTFATVLRAFLRQDPDIIMIGEMRDPETATIAMTAAQTGHLVLSTLHTNSALETLARLQSLGIPSNQMTSALSLIIAQRLVRKLCEHCKQTEIVSSNQLRLSHENKHYTIFRATGCDKCLQGYQGRTGIYELLAIDGRTVEEYQASELTTTLQQSAREKVLQGITSLAEMHRVLTVP